MKKLLLSLLAISMAFNSWAQTALTASGTVLDENATTLPFTNVLLMSSLDSTLAKAVVTDLDGTFLIEDIKENSYFIQISMVGYEDFITPKFQLNEANSSFKMQPIKMQVSTSVLDEVKVVAKKPFIEQHLDRTVLNVENSIVASGNTLIEILEKAPGVVIDRQNDQIKLKNKTGVLIMIDGRKNYLSKEALMQMLNNTNSDQVASIEIITNPSSKYDAEGNSGIINIKLKKNQSFGTNGNLSLSGGKAFLPDAVDDLYRGSANLSLNHRNEKWNVYGTGNVGRNSHYNDNTIMRTTNFEGLRSEFDQVSKRSGKGIYSSGRLGADFFATDKTTFGILADINYWDGTGASTGLTEITETQNQIETFNYLLPASQRANQNLNFSGNLNMKHNFDDKGREMTVDVDYSAFRNEGQQDFNTTYYDANDVLTSTLLQQSNTNTDIDIFAAKVDFSLPTENKIKIEFGAKSSFVKTNNNYLFEVQEEGQWIIDEGKTNNFIYKEFVNAAYFNTGYQWEKIGVQVGVRAEHTKSQGNSVTLDKVVDRNYFSAFPTIFINQKLSKDHSLRYSYSRRIGRPNYQSLNPFLFFLDPYTFEKGNPFLNPQFTDNVEVTYTFKGSASLSLGYAHTKDNMIDIIQQEDESRVTYQTMLNLQRTRNYSANLSFPIPIAKWWNMHNNVSFYYNDFYDTELSGGQLESGAFAYNFYTGNTFTLKNNWSAELNMWYNSPGLHGIIKITKPQYAVNFGVQKSFWEKKGRLKLNVNDLFLTSFFEGSIDYQNVDLDITNRFTSRRASLTFTYNFGNSKVKSSRKRQTATSDLKQRAGGND